jgi:hypothetical protein
VISNIVVTPSCDCPTGYQLKKGGNNNNCQNCSTDVVCAECEVEVEVFAEGATQYKYYLYEESDIINYSDWTEESSYTLQASNVCEKKTMTVVVYAKNECSTQVVSDSKEVTFNGGECESCCNYYLHQSNANWQGGSGDWDVHVEGLIKGNNCGKSLEVIVKIYDEDGNLKTSASLGTFTPNPGGNGNINFNGTVQTNQGDKPNHWKYKVIIEDPNKECQTKESDQKNINK